MRIVLLLLSSCLSLLWSQATEGTILGQVTDGSGAAVPGAIVVVTSQETGARRTVNTSPSGEFVATNLGLGNYVVRVEAKGFRAVVHPPVQISVKSRVRVDSRLEVGEMTQTVEVSSAAPLLKTDTPEVGGVITQKVLQEIPVFGRNFMSLAALVPGTTAGASVSRQRDFSGAALTVAGASAEANNFIIDGISNNMEFSGATAVIPAIDAIQEFAVQTSQYSAEFGRSGGGVVNVAIKSGTNQIRGFAYDYLRNDKLDARPYDFTRTNIAKQPVRRNQFGAGAGGPVIRNRAFLFGNYEGTRFPSNSITRRIVPTALEKSGNFSGGGVTIYDPTTGRPDPANAASTLRDAFPGNVIPASRFDPITRKLLGYYPAPNYRDANPIIRDNYLAQERNTDNLDSFTVKSDNNVTAKDTLMGRISQQRGGRFRGGWMPDSLVGGIGSLDATNTGLTYTRLIRPTMLNELRMGYNYLRFGNEIVNHEDALGEFKIPGYNITSFGTGLNAITLRNFTGTDMVRPIASVPNPFFLVEHSWQFMDNLSVQRGSHALKFGGEYGRVANNRFQVRPGGGTMSFDGTYTTRVVGQALETLRTGVPDALLGLARGFTTQYAFDAVRIRTERVSGFAQDDWRVRPNLTLSLGLRYEFFGPYGEEQNRFVNFNMATGERLVPNEARPLIERTLGLANGTLPAGFRYVPLDQVVPRANYRNFSPRFGFAYTPRAGIVLRGGYGIFYAAAVSNNANNAGTEGNPFFFDFALASDLDRPIVVRNGFPASGVVGALSTRTFAAYYSPIQRKDPYTQKYSFNVQLNPFRRVAFELGYTGQRALAFPTLVPGNVPQPGPGTVQDRRPFPNVGAFWRYEPVNDSNYNGLEITARMQRWHGLALQSAFTFSRVMGYSQGTDGQSATDHINDSYNFRYDYGPLNYDFRKRWVTAWTYDLPAPGESRAARWLLKDWQLAGLVSLQGGFPFQVGVTGPTLNNGTGANRANMIRNGNLPVGERTVDRWFDTAAFTAPPNFVWGAQGKNQLRGPGLINFDLAIQKAFRVTEGKRFLLRAESTNSFNRVQYGLPAATLGGVNYGIIRGLQAGPRNIQLVGRFAF